MAFCQKCGAKLADGAKFCPECGTAVGTSGSENGTHDNRVQKFDGEIRKCPSCGTVLKSFQSICPECGHELRNTGTASAIQKFAEELKNVKGKRKASVIDNFIIPNNREEILELLILSSDEAIKGRSDKMAESDDELVESWEAKFNQAYNKARISFGPATPEFQQVEQIKKEFEKKFKGKKRKSISKMVGFMIFAIAFSVLMMFGIVKGCQAIIN